MIRPFVKINIQQVPTELWRTRNSLVPIDFACEYTTESSWENHTDTAVVRIPKNIVLQTDDFLFNQTGTYNVVLGGSGASINGNEDLSGNTITYPPLIMKGDRIYISDGYWFKNRQWNDVSVGQTVFSGYVTEVSSEVPIEIKCEDNFYLLKRVPVNKSHWKGNLIDLCKYMVNEVNAKFGQNSALEINGINPYPTLSVSEASDSLTANFSLGFLDIGDETCAQLLDRIRTDYKIESFFSGDELRFGFPIYDESKADNSAVFEFENNILPEYELRYNNKDDIELSTVVSCQTIKDTGKKTKDGLNKTKKENLKVLVYWDVKSSSFKHLVKKTGQSIPKNTGGERHECIYPVDLSKPLPSTTDLYDFGVNQLKKYMYTGFKGSFRTIGYPFVKWGDNVTVLSRVFADRNGVYKVKKVIRSGGNTGITQEIFLDYKLNVPVPTRFKELYMI